MAKNKHTTPEVKGQILLLTKQGVKQIDVARKLDISRATVHRVTGKTRPFKVSDELKEQIWKLRGQMKGTKEIAKITGVSEFSVCAIAREKFPNMVVRQSGSTYNKRQKKVYPEKLIETVREHATRISSVLGIAKKLGTSRYAIAMILKENDIKLSRAARKKADVPRVLAQPRKARKPETKKEVREPKRLKTIDPIKGKVKLSIPERRMEVYVYPHQLEETKRKYNLI